MSLSAYCTTDSASLASFMRAHAPVLVLTGAGVSTDSGIPAYRDSAGNWKRAQPVQHQDFMGDPAVRQRYWARSIAGWPVLQQACPNAAHVQLAVWEAQGLLRGTVTQNVDGLHQKAGSQHVIDLHGRADQMICTACGSLFDRHAMHERCLALNPAFRSVSADSAPDGDADLEMDFSAFRVPECERCAGVLKTNVVFFGDNVPRCRVAEVEDLLSRSGALLVIGSSLMVFSGFRFARAAHRSGKPLGILTRGRTRADDIATIKWDASISDALERAAALL